MNNNYFLELAALAAACKCQNNGLSSLSDEAPEIYDAALGGAMAQALNGELDMEEEIDGLAGLGFLKKLRRRVKRIGRRLRKINPVSKIINKVGPKLVGKKNWRRVKKVKQKLYKVIRTGAKVAVVGAGLYFGGAAIAPYLAKAGSFAKGLGPKAMTFLRGKGGKKIGGVVGKYIKNTKRPPGVVPIDQAVNSEEFTSVATDMAKDAMKAQGLNIKSPEANALLQYEILRQQREMDKQKRELAAQQQAAVRQAQMTLMAQRQLPAPPPVVIKQPAQVVAKKEGMDMAKVAMIGVPAIIGMALLLKG